MGPQLIHSLQYLKFQFKKIESGASWRRHSAMPTGTLDNAQRVFRKGGSSVQERKWILMEHEYDRIEVDLNSIRIW